ncbi:hypothetical protein [Microbispora sp. NBRC 16548]|uniref:hypothetical protein n=1 Tax=Microbispora sp. NBRC 16548 TaxID=3030994 RepID=UPI0024A521D1|nr:hypothetical protein [Microbispora sp. NBRC 16548]GLX06219.1 hypothetical protein Misp03_31460 [Microbispora sp. NBRC 16548]
MSGELDGAVAVPGGLGLYESLIGDLDAAGARYRLIDRQAFTVPAGMSHRPVVPVRSAVLMIEKAGVIATGD